MKKFLLFFSLGICCSLFSNPSRPTITQGNVKISSIDSQLQIQASDGSVIHWNSFSIAPGECTKFIQPSSDSSVLNRVAGSCKSELLGRLEANGHILLLNPNGILIGKDARIDTAGFLASTLNLSDEDFLAKKEALFKGDSQESIENLGTIHTPNGNVILLAHIVKNNGSIDVPSGKLTMETGCEILLQPEGSTKIFIKPSLQGDFIENRGQIAAFQTELRADGNPYAKAIRLDGEISTSLVRKGGQIVISSGKASCEVGGSLFADQGEIQISSSQLHIEKQASLAAPKGSIALHGKSLHSEGKIAAPEGSLSLQNGSIIHTGELDVSGEKAGAISIDALRLLNGGKIMANSSFGQGGTIRLYAQEGIIETTASLISANGQIGGQIVSEVKGSGRLFTSGSYETLGQTKGGLIHLLGPDLCLVAVQINASGQEGGGDILIGGDFQGKNSNLQNAKSIYVSGSAGIKADACRKGNGGKIILWSDEKAEVYGDISSCGGFESGDGGFVEISGKEHLSCSGRIANHAIHGESGTIFMDPANIVIDNAAGVYPQYQFLNPDVSGGGAFGKTVLPLPKGNVVITNPDYLAQTGAVYLFDGLTAGLISALTGTNSGDLVGYGGVTVLSNGNYVANSFAWNIVPGTAVGAATFCSSSAGLTGVVSSANSLVGNVANDRVGRGGIIALTNGNYVVCSPDWNARTGSATFCKGDGSTQGAVISSANSLLGSLPGDFVGGGGVYNGVIFSGATALTNGNYVVCSPLWNNNVGAATFCKSDGATRGAVISSANSLLGNVPFDFVGGSTNGTYGGGATALPNGNYVVCSPLWNNNVGAATFCKSNGSTTGAIISSANSRLGSLSGDYVSGGQFTGVSIGGVTVLSNGNYVVFSPLWNHSRGAATYCTGLPGAVVSSSNSLVGSVIDDLVGLDGVTALSNGNYVVCSPYWNVSLGAATFCPSTGLTGAVISASNSLVGSAPNDYVGFNGSTALSNGNYVVCSGKWNGTRGAATFCKSDGSTVGAVISASNSLVGSAVGDQVGSTNPAYLLPLTTDFPGAIALSNGNYAVNSSIWNGTRGAVTFGTSDGSTIGFITSQNSIVGQAANAQLTSAIFDSRNQTFICPFVNENSGTVRVGLVNPNQLQYFRAQNQTITTTSSFITDILNQGGNVILQALNDITINSPIVSSSGANLTLQAGGSLSVNANINVDGGNLYIVADSLASPSNTSPTSQLIIGPGVSILGGKVGFWSAIRAHNVIDPTALINGSHFSSGAYWINTPEEIWGTFYPQETINHNFPFFTFFYQEGASPASIVRAQDQSAAGWGEFFAILHPFNEYIWDYLLYKMMEVYEPFNKPETSVAREENVPSKIETEFSPFLKEMGAPEEIKPEISFPGEESVATEDKKEFFFLRQRNDLIKGMKINRF